MINKLCYTGLFLTLLLSGGLKAQESYELLYLKNETDSIIQLAHHRIHQNQADSNDYYWYGVALDREGKALESIQALEDGIGQFPGNTMLEKLLARFYFRNGLYTKSAALLKKYPRKEDFIWKRAQIYEFNEHYSEAIQLLKILHQRDTANIKYLKYLGNNYYRLDSMDQAIDYYEKALTINPYDQLTAYRLSSLYRKEKRFTLAVQVCDTILSKDSLNIKFLKQAGYIYHLWKKYEKSYPLFSKILQLGDSSTFIYKHMGIAEVKMQYNYPARKHLLKAYKKDTTDFAICFFLGQAFASSNKPEKGLFFLNRADSIVRPRPKLIAAINEKKISIYHALKKYNTALDLYHKSYEITAKPEYLFYMASIYNFQLKNKEKALEYYQSFLNALPSKKNSNHEMNKDVMVISLQKTAEDNIKQIKEDLFWQKSSDTTIQNTNSEN